MIPCSKILAVGAHPDDIEYGCLGFLFNHRPHAEVHLYVATLGSKGDPTSGPERGKESRQAFKQLDPVSLTIRERIGLSQNDFGELLEDLTQTFNRIRPDVILTLGPNDTHQEHRLMHDAVVGAARRLPASILNYAMVSNTPEFQPNYFVDISSSYELKKQAIRCHRSQADRSYMADDCFQLFHSSYYARLHGLTLCESFEVVRLLARN